MNSKHNCLALLTLLLAACHAAIPGNTRPRHLVEITGKPGTLFLDTISAKQLVMKQDKEGSLVAYRIGFTDSSRLLKAGVGPDREYFSFRMQHNWKALVQGDSMDAVFYHPIQGIDRATYEGILVFELDRPPDTLVYTDERGEWAQQIIVLKNGK